jgi:hypothetical protein
LRNTRNASIAEPTLTTANTPNANVSCMFDASEQRLRHVVAQQDSGGKQRHVQ